MRTVLLAFGLLLGLPPFALAKEPLNWTFSRHGGTTIEIPTFIAHGKTRLLKGGGKDGLIFDSKEYGAEFSQYKVIDGTNKRPIEYIYDQVFPRGSEVKYEVDKPLLGVVSMEFPGQFTYIYYNMCQKNENENKCFDISYRKNDQSFFEPIVERIVRSFRKSR
ncbi:hypothetical protein [Mesorhizobium comanense]|uniref:hypothetical protein n=1 Tax=Mesorhizobium comanense TaxID=2502215 RepID=UPI0010F914BD|nr:hypothetical protein [Mesorhizobium comanense]